MLHIHIIFVYFYITFIYIYILFPLILPLPIFSFPTLIFFSSPILSSQSFTSSPFSFLLPPSYVYHSLISSSYTFPSYSFTSSILSFSQFLLILLSFPLPTSYFPHLIFSSPLLYFPITLFYLLYPLLLLLTFIPFPFSWLLKIIYQSSPSPSLPSPPLLFCNFFII